MLKTGCINPLLIEAIAFCGHGDKVLLVDGNYPLAARSGEAKKIFLGVKPVSYTHLDVYKRQLKSSANQKFAELFRVVCILSELSLIHI